MKLAYQNTTQIHDPIYPLPPTLGFTEEITTNYGIRVVLEQFAMIFPRIPSEIPLPPLPLHPFESDVFIMLLWRNYDVMTSLWRYDVIMKSWRHLDFILRSWRFCDIIMTSSCYDVMGLSILICWTLTSTSSSATSATVPTLLDYRAPQRG